LAVVPDVRLGARENRAFLHRAVRHAAMAGVSQFLDVGTGIPNAPNVHDIAQAVDPAARVVYVDNDPLVLLYARALLSGAPEGVTAYLSGDVRQPAAILMGAVRTLDLSRPVGLSLNAVLHFVRDEEDPAGIVATFMDALAPGSLLIVSHGTGDFTPEATERGVQVYRDSQIPIQVRSRGQVAGLVPACLDLLEPGLTVVHRWRPDDDRATRIADRQIGVYGLVAVKR